MSATVKLCCIELYCVVLSRVALCYVVLYCVVVVLCHVLFYPILIYFSILIFYQHINLTYRCTRITFSSSDEFSRGFDHKLRQGGKCLSRPHNNSTYRLFLGENFEDGLWHIYLLDIG